MTPRWGFKKIQVSHPLYTLSLLWSDKQFNAPIATIDIPLLWSARHCYKHVAPLRL